MVNILAFIKFKTAVEITLELASRVRARRVQLVWTQKELSERSGVSLGSYKRFEQTGRVELLSLVKVVQALNLDQELESLFEAKAYESLDEIERGASLKKGRARASGKSS